MIKAGKSVVPKIIKYKPTLFDSGIGARLPNEYKKFYDEWKCTVPQPVHYIPETEKWKFNEETAEVKQVENVPLPAIYTKELQNIFTGGENIILGFLKKSKYSSRVPRFWMPVGFKSVVYSEILDKYISVIMTRKVVDHIYDHHGFDKYILETKACDLQTLVALKMKRKLLIALRDRDLPYDSNKNAIIYEKYKKYLIPSQELEWYGLSFTEACKKQEQIEIAKQKASIIPLKQIYRAELFAQLKNDLKS